MVCSGGGLTKGKSVRVNVRIVVAGKPTRQPIFRPAGGAVGRPCLNLGLLVRLSGGAAGQDCAATVAPVSQPLRIG